jgi:type IV pilus assembly protein PilM
MSRLLDRTADLLARLTRARHGPIGLHVARDAINLVQLDTDSGRVTAVRGWASVPLPPGDDVLESPKRLGLLLRKALASGGFKGRRVVTAMPHGAVRIHSVTYQASRERTATEEILGLMQERLEGPLADHVLDFLPVRDGASDGERLALVAVSRRDAVIAYLELLRRAGLEVEALEVGPAAIRRLVCAMSPAGEPENVLVINAGDNASFMTMISGRRLLFDQEIEFGERKCIELVAGSLDMPEQIVRDVVAKGGLDASGGRGLQAESLASAIVDILRPELKRLVAEIERGFLYAASEARGIRMRRVYLVGSLARWPGADRQLAAIARMPVTNIPDPLAVLAPDARRAVPAEAIPEIAVATGLALRGAMAAETVATTPVAAAQ